MWIVNAALSRPYTFVVLALLIFILSPLIIMRTPTDIFRVRERGQAADQVRHHRNRALHVGAPHRFIGMMTHAALAAHEQHRHGTD